MSKLGTNDAIAGGGFHHLAIRCYDYDTTLKFYIDGLGCTRRYGWGADERGSGGKDSRACMLDTGDGNYLEVFAGGTKRGADEPEPVMFHFALRTNDCVKALERARAAGAIVTVEPKKVEVAGDVPEIFHIAFCKGPDGEVIEFFENANL